MPPGSSNLRFRNFWWANISHWKRRRASCDASSWPSAVLMIPLLLSPSPTCARNRARKGASGSRQQAASPLQPHPPSLQAIANGRFHQYWRHSGRRQWNTHLHPTSSPPEKCKHMRGFTTGKPAAAPGAPNRPSTGWRASKTRSACSARPSLQARLQLLAWSPCQARMRHPDRAFQ